MGKPCAKRIFYPSRGLAAAGMLQECVRNQNSDLDSFSLTATCLWRQRRSERRHTKTCAV